MSTTRTLLHKTTLLAFVVFSLLLSTTNVVTAQSSNSNIEHDVALSSSCWPNDRIPDQKSKASPSLAVYDDKLYMVHLGDSSNDIWYSTFDGRSWTPNKRIPDQKSKASPALAVYDNKLYMIHLGDSSNDIWYSSFDGRSWTPNKRIPDQQSKASPALAVYDNKLYMIHLGDSSNNIWFSVYDNGWLPNMLLSGRKSKVSPALALYGDKWHMVNIGDTSNNLWHSIIPFSPESPSGLSFSEVGKREITIHWTDQSTNEEQFILERSFGREWQEVDRVPIGCDPAGSTLGKQFSLTVKSRLAPGNYYCFRVRAWNYGGYSAPGTGCVRTKPPELPASPSDLRIIGATDSSISLTWQDNANNEDGFEITWFGGRNSWSDDVGSIAIHRENSESYKLTGLHGGYMYCVKVRAFNLDGNSALTDSRCVTLAEQEPTESPPPPQGQGISRVEVFNCNLAQRYVYIWTRDVTSSTWVERGGLPAQYENGSCPGPASPLQVPLEDGRSFWFVVVDPGLSGCNGQNNPEMAFCQKSLFPRPLQGDAGGPILPYVVN